MSVKKQSGPAIEGMVEPPKVIDFQGPIAVKSTREDRIEQAASWYAANRRECPRPIVSHLRARFGLSAIEAVAVIRRAA